VQTADEVVKYMGEREVRVPKGIGYVVPYNSTMFVRAAIKDVLLNIDGSHSGWSSWWSLSSCRTGALR